MTKEGGIYYWRKEPRLDLPIGDPLKCKHGSNYDDLKITTQQQHNITQLIGTVDLDHAGDTTHCKSVTGIAVKLAGGVVLYTQHINRSLHIPVQRRNLLPHATLVSIYCISVASSKKSDYNQEDATILYKDNQGALLMANAQRPTNQTKHMELKYFSLQEWIQ